MGFPLGPITTALRDFIAAGMSGDALISAIDRLENSILSTRLPPDNTAQRRREWDREYRRRLRGHPPDIHPIPPVRVDTPLSFLREDSKKEKRSSCATRCPPDWKPNDRHYELGHQRGFSREQVDGHAEDMRLWADANAHRPIARKLDWNKAFAGWLRRIKSVSSAAATPKEREPTPPSAQDLEWIAEGRRRKANGTGSVVQDGSEAWPADEQLHRD